MSVCEPLALVIVQAVLVLVRRQKRFRSYSVARPVPLKGLLTVIVAIVINLDVLIVVMSFIITTKRGVITIITTMTVLVSGSIITTIVTAMIIIIIIVTSSPA